MINLLIKIFVISFFLNLLWEIIHSQFYTTCLEYDLKKYIKVIINASIKDALFITLFYLFSVFIFDSQKILTNSIQLLFYIIISLLFSFIDEKISLKLKRWKYSKQMPKILGVGISPLFELVVTGVLSFWLVFGL